MLWLAGLMGIIGAGAASFVLPQTPAEDDDDMHPEQDTNPELYGDLLDDPDASIWAEDDFRYIDPDLLPEGDTAQANAVLQDIVEAPYDADIPVIGADVSEDMAEAGETPLWEWIMQGAPAEVLDYTAEKESLVLVWDDLEDGASEPEVRVEQDPFDPEVMHVVMNDYSVAEVYGDPNLSASDLTVIPLSSALIVGLEPAEA
jgi:hypothetical protein